MTSEDRKAYTAYLRSAKKMKLLLLLFVTQKLGMLEFKLILQVTMIQKVNLKENLLLYLYVVVLLIVLLFNLGIKILVGELPVK